MDTSTMRDYIEDLMQERSRILADCDRWRRTAQALADALSIAQRGDTEGASEIADEYYERVGG